MPAFSSLSYLVDLSKDSIWISAASIVFNPLVWNIVARNEHRNRTITKALGSPYRACYFLAISIISAGFLRDFLFERAIREQPSMVPGGTVDKIVAASLFVAGQILVWSSTWALGVTGTYLGDYCGLLQDSMVTGFPFNVQRDPMYNGSTMSFLGTALWYRRPAGVLLSLLVWIVYRIALRYEGPFTSRIYAEREEKRSSVNCKPAARRDEKTVDAPHPTFAEVVKQSEDSTSSTPDARVTRSRSKA